MTKSLLITGGAQRLGREMAVHLAGYGYNIVLHYHSNEAGAYEVKSEIENAGRTCHLLQADLSDSSTYDALVEQAYSKAANLCGLINNASTFIEGTATDTDLELFEQQFNVNAKAPFFLTQSYVRRVKKGCVINMLDTFIHKTSHSYFQYLLSKKFLADYTQMAAKEFAPAVRVNGIAPGTILPQGERFGEPYMQEKAKRNPMQRLGTPEDICRAAQTLLEHDYMVGQVIYVDGGERLI